MLVGQMQMIALHCDEGCFENKNNWGLVIRDKR